MYRILVFSQSSECSDLPHLWEEKAGVVTVSMTRAWRYYKACCVFWRSLKDRNCNQVFLSCFSYCSTATAIHRGR